MKVYPEKIKITPPYITFKLKEIPCGVSFSQKKKDKQNKILETRKKDMLTKSNTGRMSQLSMVTAVESRLDTERVNVKIVLPDGSKKTKWNVSVEAGREFAYNYWMKNHNISNKVDDYEVIFAKPQKIAEEARLSI